MKLDELERALDFSNPESPEQWDKISRETGMFTVVLFALSASPRGDVLGLAGTGTLVAIGGSHYILTAAHVWENVLKPANRLGITLRENDDHQCLMDTRAIVPFGPSKPGAWNEWGPDIIFLRIPAVHVGEIEAFRVFYRLGTEQRNRLTNGYVETHLLMGTPYALGTFSQNHASVQIVGFMAHPPTSHTRNGFDYLDVQVRMPVPNAAGSFGGVSGGGLWKVRVHGDPSTGAIDSLAVLQGVAFYEFDVNNGLGTIRCHGLESIRSSMPAS